MQSSEAPAPTPAPIRIAAALGRAVVSVMLALIAGEIGLRLGGVKFTGSFYCNDPATGWVLRPNAQAWSMDEHPNYVRINSAGQHDHEHPVAKPPGTFRIAVLGDSMTASIEVAAKDTSSAVMERSLAPCAAAGARKIEVLNFGVPGFNTAQMLLTLRSRVWQYSPDVVLLEFFSGNEVLNNRRDLTNANPSVEPFYALQDGRLKLDDSYRSVPAEQPGNIRRHNRIADVMNRVRLLQLANEARKNLVSRLSRSQRGGLDPRAAKYGADYQLRLFYTPPSRPEIQDAWRVTEAILIAIRDEARAHGTPLWLAVYSNPVQLPHSPAEEALYGRYGSEGLLYPDWRFATLARREGVPTVVLTPFMQEYANRHHVYLSGWPEGTLGAGHWNELGQRLAGEHLAEEFCPLLGP